MGHALVRLDLDQDMHMVLHDRHLVDIPPVQGARLVEQFPQADGHFAEEHPPAIFRYPYEMYFETMFRMGSRPVYPFLHTLKYATDRASDQRQEPLVSRCAFIPALKSAGFFAR